jgi:hypothetical protein
MDLPTDVAQQAIDACGSDYLLGDLEDGSRPAQILLRAYTQCLPQLLRGANWDFARKQTNLTLIADATGQTVGVGNVVPVPWIYEYAYPTDCVKARFIPWNPLQTSPIPPGNIVPPGPPAPPTTGAPVLVGNRIRPARFVIATDPTAAYLPTPPVPYDQAGISPQGQTVVLTNVQNAVLIYTALMQYPSVWDSLFRAALVSYIASEIALPLAQDKKFGLAMRAQNIAVAKAKIEQARIRDGNEGFYSSDIRVDWMATRRTGGYGGWGSQMGNDGNGPAVGWGGWDSCGFADGSAY